MRRASVALCSVGSPSASSLPLQCSDCVPPSTADKRLQRNADDVVGGLLRRQRAAGGLGVEAQLVRARIGGAVTVAHQPGPEPPRGAELGDLLEEVVVGVEEEREARAERVDVEARRQARLDVGAGVGQRERHFLDRGRAGLTDVVAADRDRVPLRHLAFAERDDVGDDPQRRSGRIDVGAAGRVLLQDVVLDGTSKNPRFDALSLGDGHVECEQDDGRRVDRHRRGHRLERNAVEERAHVFDRVDGHADAAHFAGGKRMIRVVADLRRQIEGDAQPFHPLREQVAIPRVRFGGGAEPRVLSHRPGAATVHRGLDAASKRETPRQTNVCVGIDVGDILGHAVVTRFGGRRHALAIVARCPRGARAGDTGGHPPRGARRVTAPPRAKRGQERLCAGTRRRL